MKLVTGYCVSLSRIMSDFDTVLLLVEYRCTLSTVGLLEFNGVQLAVDVAMACKSHPFLDLL